MALKFKGAFAPVTGAMKAGNLTSSATDPYWDNVSLLLHADDGAFDVDSSSLSNTVTLNGSVTNTTTTKFGSGAYSFSSSSVNNVAIPYSDAWMFGTDDYTIECMTYANSGAHNIPPLVGNWATSGLDHFIMHYDLNGTNEFTLWIQQISASVPVLTSSINFARDTWHHVAISRVSGVTKMFVNGIEEASSSVAYNITNASSLPLYLGYQAAATVRYINGFMDEIRITKGVGRYTTAFTPPTEPFPNAGDVQPTIAFSSAKWSTTEKTAGYTLSNGDLTVTHDLDLSYGGGRSDLSITSGKHYWEVATITQSSPHSQFVGILNTVMPVGTNSTFYWDDENTLGMIGVNGNKFLNVAGGANSAYGTAFGTGDVVGVAFDMDIGAIWMSINGVWQGGATIGEIEAGNTTNAMQTGLLGSTWHAAYYDADNSFNWTATTNFGASSFTYTAPTGFV